MHFFFSVFHQISRINAVKKGYFINFEGEQMIFLRQNFLDLIGIARKSGKLIFLFSSNFFRIMVSVFTFRLPETDKDQFCIMDVFGNSYLVSIENCGKFIITSQRNVCNKTSLSQKNILLSALNKKFLIQMSCALEKIKFCCAIKTNKNNQSYFLKKGLEIKNNSSICYSIINIEFGSENMFATLETNYNRPYDKFLIFYEISFASNTIKRRVISKVSNTSYLLISVGNFLENDSIIVCSENSLTLIKPRRLKFKTIFIPRRYGSRKNIAEFVSCYGLYCGRKELFCIFANQSGDLFEISWNLTNTKKCEEEALMINYLDSIHAPVSSLAVLSNGFLFLSMKNGNHLYFQFLMMPINTSFQNHYFFMPSYYKKNLKLIDELCSFSPIITMDLTDFTKKKNSQMLLLCGTNSRSTVRILEQSCELNLLGFMQIRYFPTGLSVLKGRNKFLIVVANFNLTTVFTFKKNFEENMANSLISDQETLVVDYIQIRKGLLQITSKKIRFIQSICQKKKIIEWKPCDQIYIINSALFQTKIIHLLIILSNKHCVLLSFTTDFQFVELQTIELMNQNLYSLFGTSFTSNTIEKWDFLVLLSKEEKSYRIYSIDERNFMILNGIYLLPSCPRSANLFIRKKLIYLIISLQNGVLVEGKFNQKNGRVENQKIRTVDKFPFFISTKNCLDGIIIFGSKIWFLPIDQYRTNNINCIQNEPADYVEVLDNFFFVVRKKTLRLLIKKKNSILFTKCYKYRLPFTPKSFCYVNPEPKTILLALFYNEKSFDFFKHNFGFDKTLKQINHNLTNSLKFIPENITGFCMMSFLAGKTSFRSEEFFLDNVIIRGSHGNKRITSICSSKCRINCKNILMISMINSRNSFFNNEPIIIIDEQTCSSHSIGIFSLQKKVVYWSNAGGRLSFSHKIVFLFETYKKAAYRKNSISSFKNLLFGQRYLLYFDNLLLILEMQKNAIKTIFKLRCTAEKISDIDISRNCLIVTDSNNGFKYFRFYHHRQNAILIVENLQNSGIIGCKILDPLTFFIFDKIGNMIFYRINFTQIEFFAKSNKYYNDNNVTIIAKISKNFHLKKIKFMHTTNQSLTFTIVFVSIDGTIGFFSIINKRIDIQNFENFSQLLKWRREKKKDLSLIKDKSFNIVDENELK